MGKLEKERELIDTLYDTALSGTTWLNAGTGILRYLGGATLMLSTHDPLHSQADVLLSLGLTPRQTDDYVTQFSMKDLWALGALKARRFGQAVTGRDVVRDEEFLRSYIYNEYLKPSVDARYMVGSLVRLSNGHHATIGIHRPHRAADFDGEDVERLNRLLPHLGRALQIRQRFRAVDLGPSAATLALDRIATGVLVFSREGRLLHANEAGEGILQRGDGLSHSRGEIRAVNSEDDRRLQSIISRVREQSAEQGSAGGEMRVRRLSGKAPYAVLVTPAGSALSGVPELWGAFVVFVGDTAREPKVGAAEMMRLFGFTAAEARLCEALAAGKKLPAIADEFGVSYHTVRTQLAKAMSRMEVNSQAELILLITKSVGVDIT